MTTRGQWGSWWEFLFSCVGCMVGLGNIWRFPYVVYSSGGAAFLLPYLVAILVCGLPLVLLEMSYCQFSNLGPGKVWVICPLFRGIGYGMVVMTAIVSLYYNVILAWTLYYLARSFSPVLPWSTCDNPWNTEHCFSGQANHSLYNVTGDAANATADVINTTHVTNSSTKLSSSTEEYLKYHVLQQSAGLGELGGMRWELVGCLAGAWLIVFLCLIRSIKSAGKVMYVAALLPYVLLLALLIRGALLPGALDGVTFYVVPRWEKLKDPQVWRRAASQVFFSEGIGWGGISTLASYNRFHNNVFRDAMVLPVIDSLTSWFSGFVIFVYLGYMANQMGTSVDQVVDQGPGLAFKAYPDAIASMPGSQVWSVLFFLMLLVVGLDSQLVHVQTLVGALVDAFPRSLGKRPLLTTAVVCMAGLALGLFFVTQGGVHVLELVDTYVSAVSVMLLALMEVLVLCWVYGGKRLYEDIDTMIGGRASRIWLPFWMIITPLFISILWTAGMVSLGPTEGGEGQEAPGWSMAVGWMVGLLPILPIPICMALTLAKGDGTVLQRLGCALQPSAKWRPALFEDEENDIKKNGDLEMNEAEVAFL